MSEHQEPLAQMAWKAAEKANNAFDEMRTLGGQLEDYQKAQQLPGVAVNSDIADQVAARFASSKADFIDFTDIAAPAMLMDDSPFIIKPRGPGVELDKVEPYSTDTPNVRLRIFAEVTVPAVERTEASEEIATALTHTLGVLAIGEGRTHVAIDVEEAIPPQEAERQKYLDMDIKELFVEFGLHTPDNENMVKRTVNALGKDGFHSLRDVLLAGQEYTEQLRNLGDGGMDLLRQVIRNPDIELTWQGESAGVTDIVRMSPTLRYVPAKHFSDAYRYKLDGYNVAEVLAMTTEELGKIMRFTTRDAGSEPDFKAADTLLRDLRAFAGDYYETRSNVTMLD